MPHAVQLLEPREPLHLVERATRAPGPGEARLSVEACALGQLDWNLLTLDAPPRLPLTPGHEAVGIVMATGSDVKLRVGERVLVTPLSGSCGACAACLGQDARHCPQVRWRGVHDDGVLASEVTLPASTLVRLEMPVGMPELPARLDSVLASHLALAGGTLWTATGAVRALHLLQPSRIAVFGIGGVGHLVVQVARALGHSVFAADADPQRLKLAQSLGAHPVEGPVDAAVVCTPSTQAVQQAVRLLRGGGRLVLVGTSPTGRLDLSVADLVWRGLTLTTGLLGTSGDLDEGLALLFAGKVKPQVETVSLRAVPERLWTLRDLGFSGRLVALFPS